MLPSALKRSLVSSILSLPCHAATFILQRTRNRNRRAVIRLRALRRQSTIREKWLASSFRLKFLIGIADAHATRPRPRYPAAEMRVNSVALASNRPQIEEFLPSG